MMIDFNAKNILLILCLLTSAFSYGASGLRSVRLMVPAAVQAGQTAKLICLYDLEGAPLYSVKWYRGQREFYRYVPKEVPATKVFPFPGIVVDISQSNSNQVELRDVQPALTGNFSCEVSADAPSFSTSFVSQFMTVVDLPEKRPVITVEKTSFQVGQLLAANCTSTRSRPPANLTFYLNDVPASEAHVIRYPGGETLGLVTPVTREVVSAGVLRLKCVASVLMFHRHAEITLEEERPKLASVLGAMEQHPSRAGLSLRPPVSWNLLSCILLPTVASLLR